MMTHTGLEIAIIGMSGRFPGAENLNQFWENIKQGKETFTSLSTEEMLNEGVPSKWINDKNYIPIAGILPDYNKFDAKFFGYTDGEAMAMDPQYRILLEEAWRTFESAGYDVLTCNKVVGLFAGSKPSNYFNYYLTNSKETTTPFEYGLYTEYSQLVTRVSYELNLKGPSVYILTACSTSLVAIHMACQSLLNGECDMALAGGIALQTPHRAGFLYQDGLIFSPDGHCRSFDKEACGTILTNGVGLVLLKRLSDAMKDGDRIDAIIKGTAINNDGKNKIGFTAPSVDGQAEVIANALEVAGIHPDQISYVEAHGTATKMGDPIEIESLTRAFRLKTKRNGYCKIGSVKTNIGHPDVAAGIAGLIKVVLSLQNEKIPASLHFNEANPIIHFEDTPFIVNNKLTDWKKNHSKRYAGVSSFGVGGTNAHAILEEAPKSIDNSQEKSANLLCLSATNSTSLSKIKNRFIEYLNYNPNAINTDIAYTLQLGRHHFKNRRAFIFTDKSEAIYHLSQESIIEKSINNKKFVFLFPGQGSQYSNMTKTLYQEYEYFKSLVDECSEIILDLTKTDIRNYIFTDSLTADETLKKTDKAQLALFVIEYALATWLQALGIQPDFMIGHSLGEYVAACISGVMSLRDALYLVSIRGQLMSQAEEGSMIAVFMDYNQLSDHLFPMISIAAINNKNIYVISGSINAIQLFKNRLPKEIRTVDLHTSHAFHSEMMSPILPQFKNALSNIKFYKPTIPYVSNFTGNMMKEVDMVEYWSNHLRHTVKFAQGIETLMDYQDLVFIEVGPGSTLSSFVKQIDPASHLIFNPLPSAKEKTKDAVFFLTLLANLWERNIQIDFRHLYKSEIRQKLSLPTYQFNGSRYWPTANHEEQINHPEISIKTEEKYYTYDEYLKKLWKKYTDYLPSNGNNNIFDYGIDSLSAIQFVDELSKKFELNLTFSWIHENPTYCQQLNSLNDRKNNDVIIFQKIKNSTPLFLIHPSRAGAEVYSELAASLKLNSSIYGINSYHLNTSDYSLNSIEALAQHYITIIKRIAPEGPYFLGGWSLGGVIAYEIAQQLSTKGNKVLSLYLFDSAVTLQCSAELYQQVISIINKTIENEYANLPTHFIDKMKKQNAMDQHLMQDYKNYHKYRGKVVLYKAKNITSFAEDNTINNEENGLYNQYIRSLFYDQKNGWNNYLECLNVIECDCCHFTIIKNNDLNPIASHLRENIEDQVKNFNSS